MSRSRAFSLAATAIVSLGACTPGERDLDQLSAQQVNARPGGNCTEIAGDEPRGPDIDHVPTAAAGVPPRAIWLDYASSGTCMFGTLDECKRQIQALLDDWYKDFNVYFTFTGPSRYRIRITWTGSSIGTCTAECPDQWNTSNAVNCRAEIGGFGIRSNAGTIAQEQGHLVGLAHTNGPTDVMNQMADERSNGFENATRPTSGVQSSCRNTQNSYMLMLQRLGKWEGGCKNGPFGMYCPGAMPDAGVDVTPPGPEAGAGGSSGGVDAGRDGAGGAGGSGAGGSGAGGSGGGAGSSDGGGSGTGGNGGDSGSGGSGGSGGASGSGGGGGGPRTNVDGGGCSMIGRTSAPAATLGCALLALTALAIRSRRARRAARIR